MPPVMSGAFEEETRVLVEVKSGGGAGARRRLISCAIVPYRRAKDEQKRSGFVGYVRV